MQSPDKDFRDAPKSLWVFACSGLCFLAIMPEMRSVYLFFAKECRLRIMFQKFDGSCIIKPDPAKTNEEDVRRHVSGMKRMGDTKTLIRRILQTVLILTACTLWLAFAIYCWNRGSTLSGVRDEPFLEPLWNFLKDRSSKTGASIYIDLSGFCFFTFYMSVLLPDLMRRFFPLKGKALLIFRCGIAAAVIAAAYFSMVGTLNLTLAPESLKWLWRNAGGRALQAVHLYMIPLSLFLILFTWVLPVVIQFFRKARKEHSLDPASIRRTAAFYGMLVLIAFLVTGASAVLLAVVKVFAPSAPQVVISMENRAAVSVSSIFLTLILAPFIEETAFRGLIQHHARRVLPAAAAILLASVYFGLWHRNLGQFVYTFTWAVLFGLIYNATGKVRHTILMHFLGNLFAVLAYSTSENAVLGRHVVLPAVRIWLMDLPLLPAILMLLLFAALLFIVTETALYLVNKKENRFIQIVNAVRKSFRRHRKRKIPE